MIRIVDKLGNYTIHRKMNSEQFVSKIAYLTPSESELIDYGFDSDEIKEIRDLFLFEKKNNAAEECNVISFFRVYKTDKKEVGGVSFFGELVEDNNQLIFAQLETDLIFQDIGSKKIYLRNERDEILHFISIDFAHFLDIVYWSAFFKKNRKNEDDSIEELRNEKISKLVSTSSEESNEDFLSILFI